MNCYYFGCWNSPGHFLYAPGGVRPSGRGQLEYYNKREIHVDGTLAPRKVRIGTRTWYERQDKSSELVYQGMGLTREDRSRIQYDSNEYPEGQFYKHYLDTGYTAIQWWDRHQGDVRGACNSTILLEGCHAALVVLAALEEHFPLVLENLLNAEIELFDVTPCKTVEVTI